MKAEPPGIDKQDLCVKTLVCVYQIVCMYVQALWPICLDMCTCFCVCVTVCILTVSEVTPGQGVL